MGKSRFYRKTGSQTNRRRNTARRNWLSSESQSRFRRVRSKTAGEIPEGKQRQSKSKSQSGEVCRGFYHYRQLQRAPGKRNQTPGGRLYEGERSGTVSGKDPSHSYDDRFRLLRSEHPQIPGWKRAGKTLQEECQDVSRHYPKTHQGKCSG